MIGISFGYPGEFEQRVYGVPDELRFARIEPGQSTVGLKNYWRRWEPDGGEELAEAILNQVGYRSREISGFTLFWNGDQREDRKPGWQMSVRRKGEDGWDVSRVTDAQAQAVFRLLETSGHPDGPWKLNGLTDARDSYIVPQSAIDFETAATGLTEAFSGLTAALDRYEASL